MTTPKPTRKARPARARMFYGAIVKYGCIGVQNPNTTGPCLPFYTLDLSTPEKFDAAVEQMAKVYACPEDDGYGLAIDALASLGITRPKDNQ